ncbi:hypothetical protein, partial [Pediococcus parvulus]
TNGSDRIANWKDLYKLYLSSPLCGKSLDMNMLDTCDSIGEGEIVSLPKKACFFLPPHKENILLRMNKILRNCPYVKS